MVSVSERPGTIKYDAHRKLLVIIVIALVGFMLAACESSLGDDSDGNTTPVTTPAQVPDQPDSTDDRDQVEPAPTVEERSDGWQVITAPEPLEPPEDRSGDQVFIMAGSSDPPATIDPALVRDTDSAFLARQVFRGLTRIDQSLEAVPDLARQIEISPDGTTYRFTLHSGITFHDDTEISAQHVKESLERATDPALAGGDGDALPARNFLDDIVGARERMDGSREDISGIRVIDEVTLEIELERGIVDFLERLANPTAFIVDTNRAEISGDWWQEPNGSGPFKLVEWDEDRQLTLQPHDGYISPPLLREVQIRVGAEAVGQMQLYETGQINIVTVPLSVLDRVEYEGSPIDGELQPQSLLSTTFVLINPEYQPYDHQSWREAIIRTFPREQVTDVMLEGRVRMAQGILPPEMRSETEADFPYTFDPDLARSLASETPAAVRDEGVTIYATGGGVSVVMKQFIEQELEIPVEVVQLRWVEYMADMEAGKLPIFLLSWVADGPDPVSFLRALFHSESPDNYGRFADPEVDRLLDQAMIEQDEQRRVEMLEEAHRIILESAVVLPLYHTVDYQLVADHVRGLESTPMGILGLETVWIEH